MKYKSLIIGTITMLCMACAGNLFAQTGVLTGKVFNDTLGGMQYSHVQLQGTSYQTVSRHDGSFRIEGVSPGQYKLLCRGVDHHALLLPVSIQSSGETYIELKVTTLAHYTGDAVITATRTEKNPVDLTVPVKVISAEEIRQMGSMRLNEVLMEQTGIAIVQDHGLGVQLQGFSSEYTLILIDGEPLVGRTAGTFDLSRITIGNIERIEIVKGPTSSLYGSEALAGVINIITLQPKDQTGTSAKVRYGTNQTADITTDGYYYKGKVGFYLFFNRYSTGGYDLNKETEDPTVPAYANYTAQAKFRYAFSPKLVFNISGRFFTEQQQSIYTFTENSIFYRIDQDGGQYDWNLLPSLTYTSGKNKVSLRAYRTFYHTEATLTNTEDGSLYDDSYFNQNYTRPELQFDHAWNKRHITTVGIGLIAESVVATRYTEKKYFQTYYTYLQHDMKIGARLNVVAGLRADMHSVYGSQLSPKLSMRYSISKSFAFKASMGRGFKAPDFRQLYLNFTNPVAGYSVFGSEEVQSQLQKMDQQGLISQYLIDPSSLQPVQAESSTSYNIGGTWRPSARYSAQVNFFRNDINHLIESSAVAIKTNGQSVYTYFNVSRVYTQGMECDFSYKPWSDLTLTFGYQYLVAKNKDVVEGISEGEYYARDPNTLVTKKVTQDQYGGLFNRSRHMFNARLFYQNKRTGVGFSFRCIYRGRYGFGDLNGNLILDQDDEYVPGYFLFNTSLNKTFYKQLTLQAGIDNIGNYTNPIYITTLPGRLYYLSISFQLSKKLPIQNISK